MDAGGAGERIPVEERLFSLVLALLATRNGLTKTEILSTVQGYRQKYAASSDNSALERQFQRDKDDLREMGVPLETFEPLGDEGNNQNTLYRILKTEYELPADITFSKEEASLLNLAALVWREGSLSGESRRALMKLRSTGLESSQPLLDYTPRANARDKAFGSLSVALEKRQQVEFEYLKPGETNSTSRKVFPLALVQFQGRWHLYATEAGSGERRTFLLRRIVSEVRASNADFPEIEDDSAARALAELKEVWGSHKATIRVEPGTDAEVRLLQQEGSNRLSDGRISLHYVDLHILADELAGFGPEVLVESPDELRSEVFRRLEIVAANHPAGSGASNG